MSLTPFTGSGRDIFSPADDIFGSFFGTSPFGLGRELMPSQGALARGLPVDVIEKDKEYELKADIPGVSKEDIKVTVDQGNVLNIQVDKKEEKKEEGATYRRYERTQNFVRRSLRFPENANLEGVKARYEQGVLSLGIPKKTPSEAEKTKRVTVQ